MSKAGTHGARFELIQSGNQNGWSATIYDIYHHY